MYSSSRLAGIKEINCPYTSSVQILVTQKTTHQKTQKALDFLQKLFSFHYRLLKTDKAPPRR